MSTFKTQSRLLKRLPDFSEIRESSSGTTASLYNLENNISSLRPSQKTESYRTQFEAPGALTEYDVEDFSTVTYNAFTQANPRFDSGHEFYTTKTSVHFSHPAWKYHNKDAFGYTTYRKGPLIPLNNGSTTQLYGYYPSETRLSTLELMSYGNRAMNATKPTKSAANLAVFIGELLLDVPAIVGASMLQTRAERFRSLGSEYLNVQFGWAPLVSDIKKLCQAVVDFNKTASQYKRDSGRVVRRRFHYPTESTSDTSGDIRRLSNSLYIYGGDNPSWLVSNSGEVRRETVKSRDIWFSGAFMYHLPIDDNLWGKFERYGALADKLLGAELNPSTLWQLSPWSWLVDWAVDVGGLLSLTNDFATDGLVLKYGYLMCHTREFNRFTHLPGVTFKNSNFKTGPISSTFFRETKERRKATPYGFGVDIAGLSPFQWSILGALGLTRAPRVL